MLHIRSVRCHEIDFSSGLSVCLPVGADVSPLYISGEYHLRSLEQRWRTGLKTVSQNLRHLCRTIDTEIEIHIGDLSY